MNFITRYAHISNTSECVSFCCKTLDSLLSEHQFGCHNVVHNLPAAFQVMTRNSSNIWALWQLFQVPFILLSWLKEQHSFVTLTSSQLIYLQLWTHNPLCLCLNLHIHLSLHHRTLLKLLCFSWNTRNTQLFLLSSIKTISLLTNVVFLDLIWICSQLLLHEQYLVWCIPFHTLNY